MIWFKNTDTIMCHDIFFRLLIVVDPFYMRMAKIDGSTELIYFNFGSESWIYVSSVQQCVLKSLFVFLVACK